MVKRLLIIFLLVLANPGFIQGATATEEAIVTACRGEAKVLYSGQTDWAPVEPGVKLHPQDSVKTLKGSFLDIKLGRNIIRLKENSLIEIASIKEQKDDIKITELDLLKGKILTSLTDIPADARFEITSPVAVSGIRGTSFSLAIMPDNFSTEIRVVKGEVTFASKGKLDKFIKVCKLSSSIISPWELAEIEAEGKGILSEQILGEKVTAEIPKEHIPITKQEYSSKFGALARVTTERSARVDGYRRLAEIMYGAVIDSKTTLEDYAIKDDKIRSTVKGVVRGARIISTEYYSDGAVSINMRIKSKKIVDRLIPLAGDVFGSNYLASPEVIRVDDFEDYLEIIKLKER
jgi:hypothetical protein